MIGDAQWEKFQSDKRGAFAVRALGGGALGVLVGILGGPKLENQIGYHEDIIGSLDISNLFTVVTTLFGYALGSALFLKKGKQMYRDRYPS